MARQQIPFSLFLSSSQITTERVGGILVLSSPPPASHAKRGERKIEFGFSEAAERSETVRNLRLAIYGWQLAVSGQVIGRLPVGW